MDFSVETSLNERYPVTVARLLSMCQAGTIEAAQCEAQRLGMALWTSPYNPCHVQVAEYRSDWCKSTNTISPSWAVTRAIKSGIRAIFRLR